MKRILKNFLKFYTRMILRFLYNNKIKRTANIHTKCLINLSTVGEHTYIGPNVVINTTLIGNYCSIAPNVVIGGMEHDYTNFSTSTTLCDYILLPPTEIGDDVWIGAGVYIRAGIKLGKGCIIGSNSTVLSDVPSMAIAVGSPAKVIKYRFNEPDKIKKYQSIDFSKNNLEILKEIASFTDTKS